MNTLDQAIKDTVRKLEQNRAILSNQPLEGTLLQRPEQGFPVMVKCPKHGSILTTTSTITWTEGGKRVYYCMLCWKEHENREKLKKVREVCGKCEPVDSGKTTDGPILRPNMKVDLSKVGRKPSP
jgi:hypothetical protein